MTVCMEEKLKLINVEFCEKHHKDIELVVIEADNAKFSITF